MRHAYYHDYRRWPALRYLRVKIVPVIGGVRGGTCLTPTDPGALDRLVRSSRVTARLKR